MQPTAPAMGKSAKPASPNGRKISDVTDGERSAATCKALPPRVCTSTTA